MPEEITAEQLAAIHVKRMTIVHSVLTASRHDLDAIAGALEAIDRDRGCGTPAEGIHHEHFGYISGGEVLG